MGHSAGSRTCGHVPGPRLDQLLAWAMEEETAGRIGVPQPGVQGVQDHGGVGISIGSGDRQIAHYFILSRIIRRRSLLAKIEGYCARLALIIHIVRDEANDRTLQDSGAIDESSVRSAINLVRRPDTEWRTANGHSRASSPPCGRHTRQRPPRGGGRYRFAIRHSCFGPGWRLGEFAL